MLQFREIALDDPLMQKVYRFRCEILCEELGFFKKSDYPDGLEMDEFDRYSDHCVALDGKGEVAAYVRMIYANPYGFPMSNHMKVYEEYERIDPKEAAEPSRIFLRADYRGMKSTLFILDTFLKDFIYPKAKERGVKYLYGSLQRNFLRLLRLIKMNYTVIGEEQEYGGMRYPALLRVKDLEKDRPDLRQKR